MPLIPFSDLLGSARRGCYAVGYFEAWDIYSLEAVLEAAEELHSPVILGIGGMFTEPAWFRRLGLPALGAAARALADRSRVPVSLLLNEVERLEDIVQGISLGFNAVMLQSAHLPFEDNVALSRRLVEIAHAAGVAVQAEIDELPDGSAGQPAHAAPAARTDARAAAAFVERTGVDALAVSVGNVHLLQGRESAADLERLREISDATNVPLVIHGGSGFPPAAVPGAIAAGAALFHVGTVLRVAFLDGLRKALAVPPAPGTTPQEVLGSHLEVDVLQAGKGRMKSEVGRRIRLYGSAGRSATAG